MRKLSFIILFICSLSYIFCFSQREKQNGAIIDKEAENIIEQIAKTLKKDMPLSIEFAMVEKNGKNQKGTLKLNESSYRANLNGNTIICNGNTLYLYQKATNEININDASEADNNILNVYKFIKDANKNFRAKKIREENNNNILDLIPRKSSEFSKVRIRVNKKTYQISSIEVHYKNSQGEYSYNILKYNKNIKINSKDFAFDKKEFPNAEIIDLR
ncbi:MAG: outer membrane lipoprotein carrier protein LolA [Bacteroidales bacterium]|jgi:outer membrane lipoprotein-sorting protein|nr:outer membrane lipoprotein carrier protein LolA [Bacteroidales bacterium]